MAVGRAHRAMNRAGASHAQNRLIAGSRRRNRRGQTQLVHRPTTETKVTLEHSKQLVRVAITATISTIAWIRRCFGPDYRWKYRSCDPADPTFNYASYKDGLEPPADFDSTPGLYQWPVITGGQQQAADKLLTWLEGGVRDAVEKGFLSKLQLNFHTAEGTASPSNIIESYTMAFTYEKEGISQLIGTEFSGQRDEDTPMLVHDANTQMINLVNSVCERVRCFDKCRESSSEPLGRKLTMKLEFNDRCPPDYQPDSFCPSKDQAGISDLAPNHEVLTMQSDFHRVSVQLPSYDPSQDRGQMPQSPEPYVQRDEDLPDTADTPDNISNGRSETVSSRSYDAFQTPDKLSAQAEEIHTQPEVMSMLEKIGISRSSNDGTQDTILLSKCRFLPNREASATVHPAAPFQADVTHRRYAGHVCEKLDKIRAHQVNTSDYGLDGPSSTQPKVACECRVSTDQENLMKCGLCDNFQHMQCYGYYESKSAKVESACYTCLLKDEEIVSSGMDILCIKRRIMYCLLAVGGNTVEEIARYIDREVQVVETFLQHLENKGYVEQRKPTKKPRTNQKVTKTEYSVIADELQLRREIFDPDLGIAHHLNFSDTFVGEHQAASLGLSTEPSVQQLDETDPSQRARENALLAGSSTQGTPSPRIPRSFVKYATISRSHSPEFHNWLPSQEETSSARLKRSHEASLNGGRKVVRFWDARSPQIVHPRI
ncbi:uncharacterized protein BP5553_04003 [Venustampulla echinocandica]|uniref:HORMA domain-containing protein n=1 Tax=Venustampulla echinocandica TaxID=2656787 RepID=A0A370TVV1_9HELO|nr:uncharacterized protein BP5553_04003 [Venustampulla echinocandica]RDL39663.1 hypothetical protein BP5553_04003 [Venustampulla echinocandica]